MNLTLNHFNPWVDWKPVPCIEKEKKKNDEDTPLTNLQDSLTKQRFWDEASFIVQEKCFNMLILTPLIFAPVSVVNAAYRIAKLCTLAHFWLPENKTPDYDVSARAQSFAEDVARVVGTPFVLMAIFASAAYGLVFNPYGGRKLIGNLQKALFERPCFTPCFYPTDRVWNSAYDPQFRWKNLALCAASLTAQVVLAAVNVAFRVFRICTLSHFLLLDHPEFSSEYSFQERFMGLGKDALRIVGTPLALVAMIVSTLEGLILGSYDARELYVGVEKALYGNNLISSLDCFHGNYIRQIEGGTYSLTQTQ